MDLIERKNPGLFRKVGDKIVLKPNSYDQSVWAQLLEQEEIAPACVSTMCVAGHTVTFHPGFVRFRAGEDDGQATEVVIEENGSKRLRSISELAAEMLDLDKTEAGDLFSLAWNPPGDGPLHERVRDALYQIADGVPARVFWRHTDV